MTGRYRILIVSFLLALPFWLMINYVSANVESFWFVKLASSNSRLMGADMENSISELKLVNDQRAFEDRISQLKINAYSYLIMDLDNGYNGKIILEKNGKFKLPIASLSKLMTASVVFDLNETYNANPEKNELLKKMLVESDNPAADNLAGYIGMDAFIDLMNYYGGKMGLNNTSFINPSGLDDDINNRTNLSTAEDLSKLAIYILKEYPEIFDITILNKQNSTSFEILKEYPEIIGSKTGWTVMAKGCLLEVVQKPDGSGYYINIILKSDDRFGEMREIIEAELGK